MNAKLIKLYVKFQDLMNREEGQVWSSMLWLLPLSLSAPLRACSRWPAASTLHSATSTRFWAPTRSNSCEAG